MNSKKVHNLLTTIEKEKILLMKSDEKRRQMNVSA